MVEQAGSIRIKPNGSRTICQVYRILVTIIVNQKRRILEIRVFD
jgi:hypothetical protein